MSTTTHTIRGVQVTDNELAALASCLNYNNREDQHSDNFSNGGHLEFKKVLGWNDKQVSALIGSMERKDLGWGDDNKDTGGDHIFWLEHKGVDIVFDAIDQGLIKNPFTK